MSAKLTSLVDPFIGVDEHGNCLCGPYMPLGLVRPGPDTLRPHTTNGYQSGEPITRFTQTHVSGTGGNGRAGNIGLVPFTAMPAVGAHAYTPHNEEASPGYYAVELMPQGIRAELTATPRVAVYRLAFPADGEAGIWLDAGAVIQGGSSPGEPEAVSIGGFVEVIGDTEVVGRADCRGGWGHAYPYSVYFYASFDRPAGAVRAVEEGTLQERKLAVGANAGVVLGFGRCDRVEVRIGISHVSIGRARASVDREARGRAFDELRNQAGQTWEQVLSGIEVEGGTRDQKALFYTAFTRLMCMPTDLGVDDENHLWESGVRQFTDYYCLWDSVRNANSLIALIDPDLHVDMLNALLDIADHTGWLADAWTSGHSANVQGGSSADVLFCESALKGLDGIDYAKALRYMRKNNEVEPPDPVFHGRYLRDYRDLGYVSTDVKGCVSRHIEYAYQDWCIGHLAAHLGETGVAADYLESSRKLWNLWRDDLKCFAPRKPDGTWVEPFDPAHPAREDFWNDPHCYEGTAYEWTLCALHGIDDLVKRHGGREVFAAHLDAFFGGLMFRWKEIVLHTPYLYHFAGRPDKTADTVRNILAAKYAPTRDGLPDNEDMGAHSAFTMWASMGLYPVMGQDIYLLSTPVFDRTCIRLGRGGEKLIIEAPGAGGDGRYITSVTLNGEPLDRCWIRHAEIARGAEIELGLAASWNGFTG